MSSLSYSNVTTKTIIASTYSMMKINRGICAPSSGSLTSKPKITMQRATAQPIQIDLSVLSPANFDLITTAIISRIACNKAIISCHTR